MTDVPVLDATLQKTNIWLNELSEELKWQDRQKVFQALRTTLQALRDRLIVEEAVDFGAQLPLLLAGVYYHGWTLRNKPVKLHKEDFLDRIRSSFSNDPDADPEQIARAVFRVLERNITEGEVKDVKACLPKDLQQLWAEAGV